MQASSDDPCDPGPVRASLPSATVRAETGDPGWKSRGYMPHFDATHAVQHVTYHLDDALPRDVLDRLERELVGVPASQREVARREEIEAWLDTGAGCCAMRAPGAAALVEGAFLHFDRVRYRLLGWVVMPNHVHVLFEPIDGWTMAKIVASWKSFTGRRLAAMCPALGARDRVWQREYWDRFIRDEEHFHSALRYIHENPVKAGLVASPADWRWSSARRPA